VVTKKADDKAIYSPAARAALKRLDFELQPGTIHTQRLYLLTLFERRSMTYQDYRVPKVSKIKLDFFRIKDNKCFSQLQSLVVL